MSKKPPPPPLSTYDLLLLLTEKVRSGEFGDCDIAETFSGKIENPLQAALRNRKTLIVEMISIHRDGSIAPPNIHS